MSTLGGLGLEDEDVPLGHAHVREHALTGLACAATGCSRIRDAALVDEFLHKADHPVVMTWEPPRHQDSLEAHRYATCRRTALQKGCPGTPDREPV